MREQFQDIKKNLAAFRLTQCFSDFAIQLRLSLLLWLFFLVTVIFTFHSKNITIQRRGPAAIWFLLIFLVLISLTAAYWIHYYRTVITAAIKIESIKQKYTLIDADKMTDYVSSLHLILDLIDSSLEREYSNRLLQKQAEFDAMRSQINPHFLYNTLDTIRGYALMEDAPLTSDMIEVLSRLFRYMISQKNELIAIRQELSILYDYIKIQEYRINQHIVFLQNIEPHLDIMDYKIPKLIIQPFIENAIKHGLTGISKDFIITLNIYTTQSRLIISIADNGSGMTPAKLNMLNRKLASGDQNSVHSIEERKKGTGTGIAITNVSARIRLLYGDIYGVIAHSTLGKGSEFQISLPYFLNQG